MRLRMTPAARAAVLLRWTLGLAGAVVALWMGGALLAAAPAAAAVPASAIAAQGLLKGGTSRPAGGKDGSGSNGKSDSGKSDSAKSESKGSDGGDSNDNKSNDNSDNNKSESKKSESRNSDGDGDSGDRKSDKGSDEKKSPEKKSPEKKSPERKSPERKSPEKKSPEKKSPEKKSPEKKSPEKKTPEKKTPEKKTPEKKTPEKKTPEKKTPEKKTPTKGTSQSDDDDSVDEKAHTLELRLPAGKKNDEKAHTLELKLPAGKKDTGADKKVTDAKTAAAKKIAEKKAAAAKKIAEIKEAAERGVKTMIGKRGTDVETAIGRAAEKIAELQEAAGKKKPTSGSTGNKTKPAVNRPAIEKIVKDAKGLDAEYRGASEKERAEIAEKVASWAAAARKALKGDPDATAVITKLIEHLRKDPTDGKRPNEDGARPDHHGDDAEQRGPPSSDEQTEKVLKGRIALARSEDALAAEKKNLAAGKGNAKTYAQHVAAHQKLAKQVAADSAKLSKDDAKLVTDVVNGQRGITKAEAQLAAEKKQVAAGKLDKKVYAAHAAALEKRKDAVYRTTEELQESLGGPSKNSFDDLEKNGASAGCGKSGMFVKCGSATKTGETIRTDSCVALAGVSNGCGVSSSAGSIKASASCTLTGSKQGCGSSSANGSIKASAWCASGTDCSQKTKATATTATVTCKTKSGTCRGNTTGPRTSTKVAANVTAASCTGRCELDGTADARGAETGCRADDGSCSVRGTARGVSNGAASCTVEDGSCDAQGSARYVDGVLKGDASADVDCSGSETCKGNAGSSSRGAVRGVAANGKPTPVRATTSSARCSVTMGDCSSEARSEVTTEPGDTAGTRVAVAKSDAGADVRCASTTCTGAGSSATAGSLTGDVKPRGTGGTATCTVRGDGGSCAADTGSDVTTQSVSTVEAKIECGGGEGTCGGTAGSETRAVDRAIANAVVRGARGTASCTVAGGKCAGTTSGMSTSAGGGAAQVVAGAKLDCPEGCTGTATSATAAFAGNQKDKGATATLTCAVKDGACGGEARSAASTTGAAVSLLKDLAKDADGVRMPTGGRDLLNGPLRLSSVADVTASIECAGGCTGNVTTSASGSDGVNTKGSDGTAGCALTGGDCWGSSRSVASAGADVAQLLPDLPPAQKLPANGQPKSIAGPAPVPGPSSFTDAFAVADCPEGCTGSAYSRANGGTAPALLGTFIGGKGARGPPATSTSSTRGTCNATDPCRVQTQSSSASGAGVNYLLKRNATKLPSSIPVTMSQSGVYAQCGGPDCTANTVSDALTSSAGDAGKSTSHSTGRCRNETGCAVGSDAVASTLGTTGLTTPPVKGKKATWIPGVAGMTQAGSSLDCPDGCDGTVTGDSTSAASPDGGASAALTAAKNGVKRPARATKSDPVATSRGVASAGCKAGWSACEAGIVTGASASVTPNNQQRFAATSAFASASCKSAGQAACPTSAGTTSVGTDNPTTIGRPGVVVPGRGAKMIGAAKCATGGACDASTNSFAADHMAEVSGSCKGLGCHAGTTGKAVATPQRGVLAQLNKEAAAAAKKEAAKQAAAQKKKGIKQQKGTTEKSVSGCGATCTPKGPVKGSHAAVAGSSCTAGAKQTCQVTGRVGASALGADASAACSGSKACKFTFAVRSGATDRFGTNVAVGRGACGTTGGAGSGWCATTALAETSKTQALAGAACSGSKNAKCTYSYRGNSAQSDKAKNAAGKALATGWGSGRSGSGTVVTSAFAEASKGQAVAGASCAGTKGSNCRYAYLAKAEDRAKKAGSKAAAKAIGWKSGKQGGGAVVVLAQAVAGRGYSGASAVCEGAANCRRSFSARTSASDSYGSNVARASARGKGTGKQGAGGVFVTAQAKAGPGYAMASASCKGAKNCRHSFSARAADSAGFGSNWAHASARGSGGGRIGSGGVSVTAQAQAGPGYAAASASCSGAANCRHSYAASAAASARYDGPGPNGSIVHNRAQAWARGSGGGGQGGGGVSVSAQAQAGPKGAGSGASCSGAANCRAGFTSYSASDAYYDADHHARARASCSGGGSGGWCATAAVAIASAKTASAGASCAGSAGVNCYHSYSAYSGAKLKTPNTIVKGSTRCGDSGGVGGDGCGTLAYSEVDPKTGMTMLYLACDGPGCKFSGTADVHIKNLIINGKAHQQCTSPAGGGKSGCTLGVQGKFSTDRSKEDMFGDVFGFCVGTKGVSCKGSYSMEVDNGGSYGVCKGFGTGGCHGEALSKASKPVLVQPICAKGVACTWTTSSFSKNELTSADGKLKGDADSFCSTSSAAGGTGCATSAEVIFSNGEVIAVATCSAGQADGGGCRSHSHTEAKDSLNKTIGVDTRTCNRGTAGVCPSRSFAVTGEGPRGIGTGNGPEVRGTWDASVNHSWAVAGGSCSADPGATCTGSFTTNVDSGAGTNTICRGVGDGSCDGDATPKRAESTGIGTGTIEAHTPDEDRSGTFQSWGWGFSPATTIGADTHETPGRLAINVGRGAKDFYTGLDETIPQFAEDVVTHFGNFGKLVLNPRDRKHGESQEAWTKRVLGGTEDEKFPLKTMMDQSGNMLGKIINRKAGNELFWEPVPSVMTAISGPLMLMPFVGGGLGAIAKAGIRTAATKTVATAATKSLVSRAAATAGKVALGITRGIAWGVNTIGMLPFKPFTIAGRGVAFVASKGLTRMAEVATGRGLVTRAATLNKMAAVSGALARRAGVGGAFATFRDPTLMLRGQRPVALAVGKGLGWVAGRSGQIAAFLRIEPTRVGAVLNNAAVRTLAYGYGLGLRRSFAAPGKTTLAGVREFVRNYGRQPVAAGVASQRAPVAVTIVKQPAGELGAQIRATEQAIAALDEQMAKDAAAAKVVSPKDQAKLAELRAELAELRGKAPEKGTPEARQRAARVAVLEAAIAKLEGQGTNPAAMARNAAKRSSLNVELQSLKDRARIAAATEIPVYYGKGGRPFGAASKDGAGTGSPRSPLAPEPGTPGGKGVAPAGSQSARGGTGARGDDGPTNGPPSVRPADDQPGAGNPSQGNPQSSGGQSKQRAEQAPPARGPPAFLSKFRKFVGSVAIVAMTVAGLQVSFVRGSAERVAAEGASVTATTSKTIGDGLRTGEQPAGNSGRFDAQDSVGQKPGKESPAKDALGKNNVGDDAVNGGSAAGSIDKVLGAALSTGKGPVARAVVTAALDGTAGPGTGTDNGMERIDVAVVAPMLITPIADNRVTGGLLEAMWSDGVARTYDSGPNGYSPIAWGVLNALTPTMWDAKRGEWVTSGPAWANTRIEKAWDQYLRDRKTASRLRAANPDAPEAGDREDNLSPLENRQKQLNQAADEAEAAAKQQERDGAGLLRRFHLQRGRKEPGRNQDVSWRKQAQQLLDTIAALRAMAADYRAQAAELEAEIVRQRSADAGIPTTNVEFVELPGGRIGVEFTERSTDDLRRALEQVETGFKDAMTARRATAKSASPAAAAALSWLDALYTGGAPLRKLYEPARAVDALQRQAPAKKIGNVSLGLLAGLADEGVPTPVLRDLLRLADEAGGVRPELSRDAIMELRALLRAGSTKGGLDAVTRFAERYGFGWDEQTRTALAGTFRNMDRGLTRPWRKSPVMRAGAVLSVLGSGSLAAALLGAAPLLIAAVPVVGVTVVALVTSKLRYGSVRGPPAQRAVSSLVLGATAAAFAGIPGATPIALTVVALTAVAVIVAVTVALLRVVGPRGVGELVVAGAVIGATALGATTFGAMTVIPALAGSAGAVVLAAALEAGVQALNGNRIHPLAARTARVAVPVALAIGAAFAGGPLALLAAMAGITIGAGVVRGVRAVTTRGRRVVAGWAIVTMAAPWFQPAGLPLFVTVAPAVLAGLFGAAPLVLGVGAAAAVRAHRVTLRGLVGVIGTGAITGAAVLAGGIVAGLTAGAAVAAAAGVAVVWQILQRLARHAVTPPAVRVALGLAPAASIIAAGIAGGPGAALAAVAGIVVGNGVVAAARAIAKGGRGALRVVAGTAGVAAMVVLPVAGVLTALSGGSPVGSVAAAAIRPGLTFEVREGDTYTSITEAMNLGPDALAAANPGRFPTLASRNLILAGEPLNVPSAWDGVWRLDTNLCDVAQRFNVKGGVAALIKANPELAGKDPRKLDDELPITIPGVMKPTVPRPSTPTPTPTPSVIPSATPSATPTVTPPVETPTSTPTPGTGAGTTRGPPFWSVAADVARVVLWVAAGALGLFSLGMWAASGRPGLSHLAGVRKFAGAAWKRIRQLKPSAVSTGIRMAVTAGLGRIARWSWENAMSQAAAEHAAATDPKERAEARHRLEVLFAALVDAGSRPVWLAALAGWNVEAVLLAVQLVHREHTLRQVAAELDDLHVTNADRVLGEIRAVLDDLDGAAPTAPVADELRARLAELDALIAGAWPGAMAWRAAAGALGVGLRWTAKGLVATLPDGSAVPVDPALVAHLARWLTTREAAAGAPVAVAEAAAWWGARFADVAGGDRVAGVLDALAVAAAAGGIERGLALDVARQVLAATGGTDALDRSALTGDAAALADELGFVGARTTALATDLVEVADTILTGIAELPAGRGVAETSGRVDAVVEAIDADIAALDARIDAKTRAAEQAREDVAAARKRVKAAKAQNDRGKRERARKATVDVRVALEQLERHTRSAGRYTAAKAKAVQARDAYVRLAGALARLPAGAPTDELARKVVAAARAATDAVVVYRAVLAETLPPREALATGFAIQELPFLAEATAAVNRLLTDKGATARITELQLADMVRASLRSVANGEGFVMVLPGPDAAELKIEIRLGEMVEDVTPSELASQLMVGSIPQGGRSFSAGANRRIGVPWTPDLGALADLMDGTHIGAALRTLGQVFRISVNIGRNEGTTVGASGFVLDGGVADNRGDSMLLQVGMGWELSVRVAGDNPTAWTDTVRVDAARGAGAIGPQDADLLRLWVSHTYAARAPPRTVDGPQRPQGRLPHHAPLVVKGLNAFADDIAVRFGAHGEIGQLARDQIRALIANDLPGRLQVATDADGLLRMIVDERGNPIAAVRITSKVVSGRIVGTASIKEHIEDLFVAFSGNSGSLSTGRSAGMGAAVRRISVVVRGLFGFDAGLGGGWSWSSTLGTSASSVAIHPAVHRFSGRTIAQELELTHEAEITWLDGSRAPSSVRGAGTALVRMSESAAYRYGLTIDAEAVVGEAADGTAVLRDDPKPGPPKSRTAEQPAFIGNNFADGKIRGVGHGLVRDITDLAELRRQVMEKLAGTGWLPTTGAVGIDPRELAVQWSNLRELTEQLSDVRLQGSYDQAAQQGLIFTLLRHQPGQEPVHVLVRVRVEADWDKLDYKGHTAAWTTVGLDIGSNTAGRSQSTETSWNFKGSAGAAIGKDTDPAEPGLQADDTISFRIEGSREAGRDAGSSAGATANQVTLVEGTSTTAVFEIKHKVVVEQLLPGGATEELGHVHGTAQLLLPSDLLPDSNPIAEIDAQPVGDGVLARMTPLAADFGAVDALVERLLPAGMRPDSPAAHHLRELVSVDGLRTHLLELIKAGYGTSLAVRAQDGSTTRSDLWLTATPRSMRLVTVSDLVIGDIHLALGSHGTSGNRPVAIGLSGSFGGGLNRLADLNGGAGIKGSRSTSRSTGWSGLGIWGRERLTIELGRHYVYTMDLRISGGTEDGVVGTVAFALPERDALQLYVGNELELPADQVADAVERFVNGTLQLDDALAHRLIHRYLADGDSIHTEAELAAALAEAFGAYPGPLAERLADGVDRAAAPPAVKLPVHMHDALGQSAIEQATWRRADDTRTELFGEVLGAVEHTVPGVLDHDPVLWQALSNAFAGKRWTGNVDAMLGERGYRLRLPVRVPGNEPGADRITWVDVTVTARVVGEPTLRGRAPSTLMIIQDYGYGQTEGNAGRSVTIGGGVQGDAAGISGGASTGRTAGSSGSTGTTGTRLDGTATFDGADRVAQTVAVTIQVRHGRSTTNTRVVLGELIRLIPNGLLDTGAVEQVTDPRELRLPDEFSVEGVHAPNLVETVQAAVRRIAGGRLSSTAMADIDHALAPNARSAFLRRMVSPGGHRIARIPLSRHRYVDIVISAVATGGRIIVAGRDVELRTVNRQETKFGYGVSDGRLLPLSWSFGGGADEPSVSFGAQSSAGAGETGGNRGESSLFIKDTGATIEVGLTFHVRLELGRLAADGTAKPIRTAVVDATGTGYITLLERDLAEARYEQSGQRPAPELTAPAPSLGVRPESHSAGGISGGVGGGVGGAGGGALADGRISKAEAKLLRKSFKRIRATAPPTMRAHGRVRSRGPPVRLNANEELLEVVEQDLVAELVRRKMSPDAAEALVAKLIMFSFRDGPTSVFVVMSKRVAPLQRRGLLARAVEHERMHMNGSFADEAAHVAHSRGIVDDLDAPAPVPWRARATGVVAALAGGSWVAVTGDPLAAAGIAGGVVGARAALVVAARKFFASRRGAAALTTGRSTGTVAKKHRAPARLRNFWQRMPLVVHIGWALVSAPFEKLRAPLAKVRAAFAKVRGALRGAAATFRRIGVTAGGEPRPEYEIRLYTPVIQKAFGWVIENLLTLLGMEAEKAKAVATRITGIVSLFPHFKNRLTESLPPVSKLHRLTLAERIERARAIRNVLIERAFSAGVTYPVENGILLEIGLPGVLGKWVKLTVLFSAVAIQGLIVEDDVTPTRLVSPSKWLSTVPVVRLTFRFTLRNGPYDPEGTFHLDVFAMAYGIMGGRQIAPAVSAPKLIGRHPVRRVTNWLRSHDLSLRTMPGLRYLTVSQLGFGFGQVNLGNFFELRWTFRAITITLRGKDHPIDLITGFEKVLRPAATRVWRGIGRPLPGRVGAAWRSLPQRMADGAERWRAGHRLRALDRIRAEGAAQEKRLRAVTDELAAAREQQRAITRGPRSATGTTPGLLDPATDVRRRIARLTRLQRRLRAAIDTNDERAAELQATIDAAAFAAAHAANPRASVPGGPLGKNLTEEEIALLIRAAVQLLRERGPPSGLLFLVDEADLVTTLIQRGAEPAQAASIVGRLYTFGLTYRGTFLVMVTTEQHTRLSAFGVLDIALEHEDLYHRVGAGTHTEADHLRDSQERIARIEDTIAEALTRAGTDAGLRLPYGSALDEEHLGALLDGAPLTADTRAAWASQLLDMLNTTRQPTTFPELRDVLHEMVLATVAMLRGEPLGPQWANVRPAAVHWLSEGSAEALFDHDLGMAADAGHILRGGVRRIHANEVIGVLHAFVDGELAPALGLTRADARMLADASERLVDGKDWQSPQLHTPVTVREWLPNRAIEQLWTWAHYSREVRTWHVLRLRDVRAAIGNGFADAPEWRPLMLAALDEFRWAAITLRQEPRVDEAVLRREHEKALAELFQMMSDVGLPLRKTMISKELKQPRESFWDRSTSREWQRLRQYSLETLSSLERVVEEWEVDTSPAGMLSLAVRDRVWGLVGENWGAGRMPRYIAAGHELREIAADRLKKSVSTELGKLLVPNENQKGPLFRFKSVDDAPDP
ncbi:hypothetical protein [Pseudonocardia sp. TRM90224]|uniref:hypothetical protein n=1 Tax=Pseudonocardia sp. TRM90224 TaxID=2812678 RepID=UPI001E641743|nr:hypothetical protein [Pseudonocardia sp. TRM90224]